MFKYQFISVFLMINSYVYADPILFDPTVRHHNYIKLSSDLTSNDSQFNFNVNKYKLMMIVHEQQEKAFVIINNKTYTQDDYIDRDTYIRKIETECVHLIRKGNKSANLCTNQPTSSSLNIMEITQDEQQITKKKSDPDHTYHAYNRVHNQD